MFILSRYAFLLPALVYLFLFLFYPLAYTLYLSVHDVDAGNFVRGGAEYVGIQNHIAVFRSPAFWPSLLVTFVFTFGSLVFQHSIGFAFALLFNRAFPLSSFLRGAMLIVWVMPVVVSASLWRWIYSGSFGILNAMLSWIGIDTNEPWLANPNTALIAVIVANIWVGIPFHMMLVHAGLQGIPDTLYEAASIDGAGPVQRLLRITLPIMRPVVYTALLLGFINTFKVFDLIYVMTSGGPAQSTNVLAIMVYSLSFEYFRLGLGAAAANVLLLIPLLLAIGYLWLRRREEM